METALSLCMRWEGFSPRPYLCPAGVPTIGYGTTRYPDGVKVTLADRPLTGEQAVRLLRLDVLNYWNLVLDTVPTLAAYPVKAGAVTSWVYNLGPGRFRSSTMLRRLRDSRWVAAAFECRKWVYAGGRKLPGLIARREQESLLILG